MYRRRYRRWLLVAAGLSLALAGCQGRPSPAPTATGAPVVAPASATPRPTATAAAPTATASATLPPPTAAATATPSTTPWHGRLPAGTIALYGAGSGKDNWLYALAADGSSTALGRALWPSASASPGGRWLVGLDTPHPARALVVENLEDGTVYTVALGVDCANENCTVGLWAFDQGETRLASLEVGSPGAPWAIAVVDLRDGSTARFPVREIRAPGAPLGWAADGDTLLVDTFPAYSEGAQLGVWGLTLPPGAAPGASASLNPRQLIAMGAYASRPRLSPDGTRLLYLARDRGYTPADYKPNEWDVAVNQLWVLDLASGKSSLLVEVTDGGALEKGAAWSPDGQEILFAQGRYDGGNTLASGVLRVRDATGAIRDVGPLPARGYLWSLDWCRPGTALVTISASGVHRKLYMLDLATGSATLVASEPYGAVLACVP